MRFVRGWSMGVTFALLFGLPGGLARAADIPRLPDGKPDFNGV